MFFALPDTLPPAGLFTAAHGILLLLAVVGIALGLFASRRITEKTARRAVLWLTALLITLELCKIAFALFRLKTRNPNEFIPLYFCSITLAAGLFSGAARGTLRRCGDLFLATGGIVGGTVFLIVPATSLPRYPAWHFLSLYSFLLHGAMVYMGVLLLWRGFCRLRWRDLHLAAWPILFTGIAALIFNLTHQLLTGQDVANLMFLTRDFPGTPLSDLYRLLPRPLFTLTILLAQAFGPFLLVFPIVRAVQGAKRPTSFENRG